MSTIDIVIVVVAAVALIAIIGLGRAGPREADEINRELLRKRENDDA